MKLASRLSFWLVMLAAAYADARPGGGHSFSGGSHSSGGGGGGGHYSGGGGGSYHYSGGGAGDPVVIFIVIVVIVLILVIKAYAGSSGASNWSSGSVSGYQPSYAVPDVPRTPPAVKLGPILEVDPDFSISVFEDYAYQLYAAGHRARGEPAKLAALAAYLTPMAMGHLAARGGPVQAVVIGSLRTESVRVEGEAAHIAVRVEANVVRSATQTQLVVEHWTFTRATSAKTKPPERTQTWPCPNCGAPWSPIGDDKRTCQYCGMNAVPGRFDWAVEQIWLESETGVGPTLTGTVEEQGNDLPLVKHAAADDNWFALAADDPGNITWDAFCGRAKLVYARMNQGWNFNDVSPARGFVTQQMLDFLRYWATEYQRQKLRNVLENAEVSKIELAKVNRDKYFDAITVRVYASGNDYTVNEGGRVVGGSKTFRRPYTEYWTFLRSSSRRGPIVQTANCANCGAPMDNVADTGECSHCGKTIDNGSFDWVLSKIEQDDVYRG